MQTEGIHSRSDGRVSPNLLILIPVYNDWNAVSLLLPKLDTELAAVGRSARVLLVDDGSATPLPRALIASPARAITRLDVLALRRNLGHQRAIAIGLVYVSDHIKPDAVLVMDGDGEDAPEDVPRLCRHLEAIGGSAVVFAERQRRSETFAFRVSYAGYRLMHRLLTGIPVRVGNFSVIPAPLLERLTVVSELWNHYAAAVFKAKLPRTAIPTTRSRRLSGRSQMNFVALVAHGLSALSVHAEVIGVRLLVLTAFAACGATAFLLGLFLLQVSAILILPNWASVVAGLLLLFVLQAVGFSVLFSFLVLHGRSQPTFIPLRDYGHFVSGLTNVSVQ